MVFNWLILLIEIICEDTAALCDVIPVTWAEGITSHSAAVSSQIISIKSINQLNTMYTASE